MLLNVRLRTLCSKKVPSSDYGICTTMMREISRVVEVGCEGHTSPFNRWVSESKGSIITLLPRMERSKNTLNLSGTFVKCPFG